MDGLLLVLLARTGREWEYWPCLECVANKVPAMLLGSSHPHNDLSIKRVGTRILLWPMDPPSHLCVHIDAGVDGGIGVRRGRIVRVVGDLGRLALVSQSPSHEPGALSALMCLGLQKNMLFTNYA